MGLPKIRRSELPRGVSLPQRRLPIAFVDDRAVAVATRKETPKLAAEVVRLREPGFSGEAEETGGSYCLDEYDDCCRLLVVIDTPSAEVTVGMGLGFGHEILGDRGRQASYTAVYWSFGEEMARVARRRGIEGLSKHVRGTRGGQDGINLPGVTGLRAWSKGR